MSDKRGKRTKRTVSKIKAQDKKNNEDCAICMNEMEENDEITQLGCKHKFHKDCIAGWFNTGKKTCPICRKVNILPMPAMPATPAEPVIINPEITDGSNPPFIAIVLCYDDNIIKTISNIDLNIHHNNTLAELKAAITDYANQRFCQNGVCTNIANTVLRTVSSRQIRHQIEINDLYYGSVDSCTNHEMINHGARALDTQDISLIDLYIDWQSKAREFMRYRGNSSRRSVVNSYYKYVHTFDPIYSHHGLVDGPGGTGNINTDFYYNIHNPDIPEEFQGDMTRIAAFPPLPEPNKTSRVPLACIVVDIGYSQTFSGGKTRKRRQKRRNSRKHLR